MRTIQRPGAGFRKGTGAKVAVSSVAMDENVTLIRVMAKPPKRGAIEVGADIRVEQIEKDIQIGAMIACEWTIADIALHYGLTEGAIRNRMDRYPHREVIPKAASWVRLALGKYVEDRLKDAESDIAARKKRLHTKAYHAIEKKLDEVVKEGSNVSPDAVHLRAAEMGIERTEGKPLDRKAILTRNENVTVRQVDGDDLEAILREAAQINMIRKPLQIAGVRDAETV